MSQTTRKFELIDDITPQAAPAAVTSEAESAQKKLGTQILTISLISLGKRFATALTNLFSLFLVGSVAVLLGRVLGEPTQNQLAGVGGYAVFCLLIDIVRRKTK